MDVLGDPDMITKHRGFASYQDRINAEVEVDKILTEQEIISNYKKREAADVFEDISDASACFNLNVRNFPLRQILSN